MTKQQEKHSVLGVHRRILANKTISLFYIAATSFTGAALLSILVWGDIDFLFMRLIILIAALSIIIGGFAFAITNMVSRFVIVEDAVISIGVFSKTILPIRDIDCYEEEKNKLTLHARRISKKVSITYNYNDFEAIRDWAHMHFKDKIILENIERRGEMLHDPYYKMNQQDIQNESDKLSKITTPFTILATIIAIIGFVFSTYSFILIVIIASILPFISVVIYNRSRGLARLYTDRTNPNPTFAYTILLCINILFFAAYQKNIISYSLRFWLICLGMTAVLSYFSTRHEHQQSVENKRNLVFPIVSTIIGCAIYSYTTLVLYNEILDFSEPTKYETTIIDKWVTDGKGRQYKIILSPWGDLTKDQETRVSRKKYNKLHIGEKKTVKQNKGLFDITYYNLIID